MSDEIAMPAAASSGQAGDLADLVQTLWPAPVSWTLGREEGAPGYLLLGDYVVMPSADEPRTLLPRRATHASAVTRASSAAHSARLRARSGAITAAMRSGAGPLFGARLRLWSADPDNADTIERALSAILDEPVTVSARLGPPRANRKPVLHVLSASAEVLAVVKLGPTALSRALVLAETSALRALGDRSWHTVAIPRLIHAGWWHGAAMLVQSPLLARRARRLSPGRRIAAMREVAESGGLQRGRVLGSAYVDGLIARIGSIPDRALADRMAAAVPRASEGAVQFGMWHGDWTDWNTAAGESTVLIWDWERMDAPVPLGFDALHHDVQAALVRSGGPTVTHALDLIARSGRLLAPFGVETSDARSVAALYLLELGTRYATDNQTTSGVAAGRVRDWILPAVERFEPDQTATAS